jgi:hypothetical protein
MASPSTVITLGYGSFGSVNLVPTLGYGISTAVIVSGPYMVIAAQVTMAGAVSGQVTMAGSVKAQITQAGATAAEAQPT